MKKSIIAIGLLVGLGTSLAAHAQTTFTGNQKVEKADCALLSETVTLGVSAGVTGAYNCSEEDNLVEVAACHEGGSRQSGVTCSDIDPLTDGNQFAVGSGCTDALIGQTAPNPSYKAFYTSSQGGVMQEHPLTGRCGTDTLGAMGGWAE